MSEQENPRYRCPDCGNDTHVRDDHSGVITITGSASFCATYAGLTFEEGDIKWDDYSTAECEDCSHSGALKTFEVPDAEKETVYKEYYVTWGIDRQARTAREAAEMALSYLRGSSFIRIFDVVQKGDSKPTRIDLDEPEDA